MKKPAPNSKKYYNGYYILEYPEKYIGNPNEIIYRSSWERKFMIYCDRTPSIVRWSSEPFSIPYVSPFDQKTHNYIIDFVIEIKTDNVIKKYLIEVKPERQTKPPKELRKYMRADQLRRVNEEKRIYIINSKKWEAAMNFAKKNSFEFKIITETFLNQL